MVLSEVDRHAIEVWSAHKICQEFPNKGWNYFSVSYHIKKVQETGNSDRRPGSGRPNSVSTPETFEHVRKSIDRLSQRLYMMTEQQCGPIQHLAR